MGVKISPEWLAGFFDGEGCVNFTRVGRNRNFVCRVTIVNTNGAILKEIQNLYGGLLVVREHKKHPKWKPFRALVWTSRQARQLLGAIEPYVIVKKPQIELLREWEHWKKTVSRFQYRPKQIGAYKERTQEAREKEIEFVERMHELNRKGRHDAEQGCVGEIQERNVAVGE